MESKELTEKTLAAGLSAAVELHDAEAVKEEITTVGRGNHTRQVGGLGWLLGWGAAAHAWVVDGWSVGGWVGGAIFYLDVTVAVQVTRQPRGSNEMLRQVHSLRRTSVVW